MIRHIVIAALRSMMANRLLSAIAILGLSIGIAALLTVVSMIRGLSSWDRFIPGYEHVVIAVMPGARPGMPYSLNSDPRIAGLLKLALPEIEAVTRMTGRGAVARHGNVTARQGVTWADPSFFDVLPLPVHRGSLAGALSSPDAVVVTRGVARKYFGRDDAVGETLDLNGRPMTVRAVIEDLPTQTELQQAGIIASALAPEGAAALAVDRDDPNVINGGIVTYLRLRPGAEPPAMQARAHQAIMPVLSARPSRGGGADAEAPLLLRVDKTIFSEKINPGLISGFLLAGGIATLLLLVASANFVNMMTARASRRATEVSMRKVCGASRGALILQFLGESIVTVLVATCIAQALVEWLVPMAPGLGQARLDYWRDPLLLGSLLLGAVLLGVAAGAWPAFVLSSFRPVRVMKGLVGDAGRAGFVRNGLTTLQFAVLVVLIIAAIVNYQQHLFALARPLGVDIRGIVTAQAECRPAFVAELRKLEGVAGAACSGKEFLSGNAMVAFPRRAGTMTLDLVHGDRDVFALYGVRPLAGTLPVGGGIAQGLVLNQSAVRKLGFASAQAAIGQVVAQTGELSGRPVVAVVPDFALYSVTRRMEATVFASAGSAAANDLVSVKLRQGRDSETLAAMDRLWTATGGAGPLRRGFLDQRIYEQYLELLQNAQLLGISALVVVFLACLGLTGLAISSAERRTKEIGIRKAMGAASGAIVLLLLTQFVRPVLWANLIAWPVAWYLMQGWLAGFAYHVSLQIWVFIAASLGALAIALLTVAGHAIWAALQKPVLALRYE